MLYTELVKNMVVEARSIPAYSGFVLPYLLGRQQLPVIVPVLLRGASVCLTPRLTGLEVNKTVCYLVVHTIKVLHRFGLS